MYTSIVTIYEYVIICMYVLQETVQFTSIKCMFCSVLKPVSQCTNLTRNLDVDQDTLTFGLHERPLTTICFFAMKFNNTRAQMLDSIKITL